MIDDCKEDKKATGTKKCVIKRMIQFNDYKNCLLNGDVVLKSQQRFKSKGHDVYTENINKIALSSNDDKRLIAPDKTTSYPYGIRVKMRWFNNIISEIPKNKGSVGVPRSNNTRGIGGST